MKFILYILIVFIGFPGVLFAQYRTTNYGTYPSTEASVPTGVDVTTEEVKVEAVNTSVKVNTTGVQIDGDEGVQVEVLPVSSRTGSSAKVNVGGVKVETGEDVSVSIDQGDQGQADIEILQKALTPGSSGVPAVYIKYGGIEGESEGGEITVSQTTSAGNKAVQEITVSQSAVQELDEEIKVEVLNSAPRIASQVSSAEELALFVTGKTENDTNLENITLNFEEIKVEYKSQGKLFGFIPLAYRKDITINLKESDNNVDVKVKFPWYRFLMKVDVSGGELEGEIRKTFADTKDFVGLNPQPEPPSKGAALIDLQIQANALAQSFELLSNILKTKHDTAKSAINNVR